MTPTVSIQYKAATIADLKAALDLVTTYGSAKVIVSPPEPPAPKASSAPIVEKGPKELLFLERSGLERMRVPADWTLGREAYADQRLTLMDAPAASKAETVTTPEEKLPVDDGKKFAWEDD